MVLREHKIIRQVLGMDEVALGPLEPSPRDSSLSPLTAISEIV